jgi:hypothetical protein
MAGHGAGAGTAGVGDGAEDFADMRPEDSTVEDAKTTLNNYNQPSFPRKRESILIYALRSRAKWIPAFAGMTRRSVLDQSMDSVNDVKLRHLTDVKKTIPKASSIRVHRIRGSSVLGSLTTRK